MLPAAFAPSPSAAARTILSNYGTPQQVESVLAKNAGALNGFDTAFQGAQLIAGATGVGAAAVAIRQSLAPADQPRVEK